MINSTVLSLGIISVLAVALGIIRLRHISLQSLIFTLSGTVLGLVMGALASVPLSKLPQPLGGLLPVTVTVAFTIMVITVVMGHRHILLKVLPFLQLEPDAGSGIVRGQRPIFVDTSVIIDGRIADIAAAGFVPGALVVPRFVLAELQNIADSEDAMRRGRGRRGLEVLNRLREMDGITVEVTDEDVSAIKEVDAKLVALAQNNQGDVLTTDYNLNRVAQIQGVRVLNVNELSNAMRAVVIPGEELIIEVVQHGKERTQGVGYLADGTMVVVENGSKLIGQEVVTEVTRVFQTVAGKMIFAVPRKSIGSLATDEVEVVAKARPLKPPTYEAPVAPFVPDEPAPAAQPSGRQRMAKPTEVVAEVSGAPGPANRNSRGRRPRQRPANSSSSIEDRLVRGNQAEGSPEDITK